SGSSRRCETGDQGSIKPRRIAYRVSSTRSVIPSFSSMFARWRSTVFLLITSISAISSLVCASAMSLTISSSRGGSGSVELRVALRDLSRGLQPGHPRHAHVEQHEVDLVGQGPLDRLGAIRGLGDDPKVGLAVQHLT